MKSKMKLFVKIVNGLKPLIFVAKSSNFDFVVGLDTSLLQDFVLLIITSNNNNLFNYF